MYLDVLCSSVKSWILQTSNPTLIVIINICWFCLRKINVLQKLESQKMKSCKKIRFKTKKRLGIKMVISKKMKINILKL